MYQYKAKLDRVVDGDTVYAHIDLGFHIWKRVNIRLYGIDAFESRTRDLEEKEKGLAAKERLIELLQANGNEFELTSHGLDKYGRSLGTILIGSMNVNETLITEGHAEKYTI